MFSFVVPMDHPSIAGHFPGNPIVPGALLIENVVGIVEKECRRPVTGIRTAKFLEIVRPDDRCDVVLTEKQKSRLGVECFVEDTRVLVAEFSLEVQ